MFDLAIIGLGPAGVEALSIALENNLNVIAFEGKQLGGTCLNVGCIPTKSILHCSNLLKEIKNSAQNGIYVENITFDWKKVISRKDEIVNKFNKALDLIFSKKAKIIKDYASVIKESDNFVIKTKDEKYFAKNIIIATGSKPIELIDLKFGGNILSSNDILTMENLPESIGIVGSGAIGLEIAYFLNNFNVKTTIVEKAPSLAPNLDIELQKRVERILKENKIDYFKDDFIVEYKNNTVKLNSQKEFEAQKLLIAVGRKQVLPEINFELKINQDCTTNYSNLFVIGDSTKQTMLAHSAIYQAKMVMNRILDKTQLCYKIIPSVIYTNPEIASVGLREQDIENKDQYIIKKILVGSIAKSWADGASDGLVKVIIKDRKIKGAHIVSKDASILIAIFNILIEKEISVDEIQNIIFPHPCFSELVSEVVKNV